MWSRLFFVSGVCSADCYDKEKGLDDNPIRPYCDGIELRHGFQPSIKKRIQVM
jgi:hypothetical protein